MALFPPSTIADYRGSPIALYILGLAVAGTLIPALIHTFLPDGGANAIAGLNIDLESAHGRQVVSLFAWAGTTQLVWGLMKAAVLFRYRALVPLTLGLLSIERILHAWNLWGPKSGDHHPPEAYVTLAIIPILLLGFILSLRQQSPIGMSHEKDITVQ